MKTFREMKAVVKEIIGREGTFIMEQSPELGYVKERPDEDDNRTNDNNEISIVYNEPLHEKEAKAIFSRKKTYTYSSRQSAYSRNSNSLSRSQSRTSKRSSISPKRWNKNSTFSQSNGSIMVSPLKKERK